MNVILMGAPGAGKGTQADLMRQRLGLPHVSSGDLFRAHIRNGTPLGKQVKAILDKGDLVPDSATIAMIRERIGQPDCAAGLILDGFPRTIPQAEALDRLFAEQGSQVDRVIYVKVPSDRLIERLAGRWFCRICQTPYHLIYNAPKVAGICDRDGGELIQRADDKPEAVANRLQVYFEQTSPLIAYYEQRGLLSAVNGELAIEDVYNQIAAALHK